MKPKYPPTGKNPLNSGVHFSAAMKSEEHWNYAQRVGANMIIIAGFIDLLIMQIVIKLYVDEIVSERTFQNLNTNVGVATLILVILILNYKTKRLIVGDESDE